MIMNVEHDVMILAIFINETLMKLFVIGNRNNSINFLLIVFFFLAINSIDVIDDRALIINKV